MSIETEIEQERHYLTKRDLATQVVLNSRLARQQKISDVYRTIELDLNELMVPGTEIERFPDAAALEYLRFGRLYDIVLSGENNFRHYDNKKELLHLDKRVYQALERYDCVTKDEKTYFPFRATPLLDECLLGVVVVGKKLSRIDKRLLKGHARAIGTELTPRYYRKEQETKKKKEIEAFKKVVAAGVHDVRNSLSVVQGYVSLASVTLREHPTASVWAGKMDNLVRKAEDGLLYVQRIFSGDGSKKEPTNLNILVTEILEERTDILKRSHELQIVNELGTANYLASVDSVAIRLAIRELITNASKYSKNGGEIIVSAEKKEGIVKLSLKNTHATIPESELSGVFKGGNSKGTGLGLSFVKRVIEENHGGKITLQSEQDYVLFEIEIPMV